MICWFSQLIKIIDLFLDLDYHIWHSRIFWVISNSRSFLLFMWFKTWFNLFESLLWNKLFVRFTNRELYFFWRSDFLFCLWRIIRSIAQTPDAGILTHPNGSGIKNRKLISHIIYFTKIFINLSIDTILLIFFHYN